MSTRIYTEGVLYLIPTPIHEAGLDAIPEEVRKVLPTVFHFVVEDIRTARRALRAMGYQANFDNEVQFFELDKHKAAADYTMIKQWIKEKRRIGLLSEAGLPCIADPGARIVKLAHENSFQVQPLTGPSSILLALISSGLSGQNFAFNGYLPIQKLERAQKIKQLEQRAHSESQTQLFMETPFRNPSMLEDIIKTCQDHTIFSIHANIGAENQLIIAKTIGQWKKIPLPNIHKIPAIFALGQA